GLWVRLLTVPKPWLYAGILTFATLATLGANGARSTGLGPVRISFELVLLLTFGILGYLLRRFGYPIAPVAAGLIFGPLAEQQLRRALAIRQGDLGILVHSPIAIVLYVVAFIAVAVPLLMRLRGQGGVLGQLATDED